ncbi:MAG: alcohol dehydrogenase [Firmicutes bacterium]|nr:alcohol dehydrogenase [Bacillota bacterium]
MLSFYTPERVEVGFNSLNNIADFVKALGCQKPLIVMDAFLTSPQIGLDRKVKELLVARGMAVATYSGITGEPTSGHVHEGLKVASDFGSDCIVAIGGGSSIDTAKAIAVLAVNPNLSFASISNQQKLDRLRLIAVPTTSGTGSEATRVSVITNVETGIKENPGHPALVPDIAVLDPQLTLSLPPNLTAFTGMDALTHAMEAYVSNKANSLTDLYAHEAMKMAGQWLEKAVADGTDVEAREKMALASCLAGVAFSNASTNLAHAGGRALGTYFHVPHGLSVALLLPFVMEFGLEAAEDRYADVAVALGAAPGRPRNILANQAVEIIYNLNDRLNIWYEAKIKYIQDLAAFRQFIPVMVKSALSGNGILTNRKTPTEADVAQVFEKLAAKLDG